MDWHDFLYLIPVCIAAVFLLAILVRLPFFKPSKISWQERLFVLTATIVGLLAVYYNFYSGEYYYAYIDAGDDTVNQYIPIYIDIVNDIRNGTFGFWNYNYGLGRSIFASQTWFFDPFNVVFIIGGLIGGEEVIPLSLVISQSMKVILCAVLFDAFLAFYCKTPLSRIIGALLYGFNGFLMLWGNHYYFATACVFLVLIAWCIELCLADMKVRRLIGLSASLAATLYASVYTGYMILLFAATYFVVRSIIVWRPSSIRHYFRLAWKPVVYAAMGCVASSMVALPSILCILGDSTRVVSSAPFSEKVLHSLAEFTDAETLGKYLTRFLGNSLIEIGKTGYYYEMPQVGCGVGFYVFYALYAQWFMSRDRKTMVLGVILSAVVFLYLINGFVPSVLYVFSGIYYRSSFLLVLLVALMISFVIDEMVIPRKMSLIALGTGYIVTIAVLLFAAFNTVGYSKAEVAVFAVLVTILAALLALFQKRAYAKTVLVAAMSALIASSLLDAVVTVNFRSVLKDSNNIVVETAENHNSTDDACSYIEGIEQGADLYRIEKTYSKRAVWLDSLVLGYNGISTYDSAPLAGVADFYEELWPDVPSIPTAKNLISYENDIDSWEQLSYLGVRYILSEESLPYDWCEKISEVEDVEIYEVRDSSIGHVYHSVLSESEADELGQAQREDLLGTTVIVDDSDYLSLNVVKSSVKESHESFDVALSENGTMYGEIETDSAGVISISVPDSANWEIRINGANVNTIETNYGFIGAYIPSGGSYAIEASFRPNGLSEGALITIASLIALIICSVCCGRSSSHARGSGKHLKG